MVEPEANESEILGMPVSDLQSDISVEDDAVSGTLNYVTGYTGFSEQDNEQSGYYLALKVSTIPTDGVVVTVELIGGTNGPITLDSNMNIVIRITDEDNQSIRVIATKGTKSITKIYTLTDLVLEDAG
jgi:hypothetical protein